MIFPLSIPGDSMYVPQLVHSPIYFPQLGVGFREVTEYYEEEFFSDMDRLRVMRPTIAPRVTEHIPHIISFIQKVIEKKLAYIVSDGECRITF